jgi:hypothetical protein
LSWPGCTVAFSSWFWFVPLFCFFPCSLACEIIFDYTWEKKVSPFSLFLRFDLKSKCAFYLKKLMFTIYLGKKFRLWHEDHTLQPTQKVVMWKKCLSMYLNPLP